MPRKSLPLPPSRQVITLPAGCSEIYDRLVADAKLSRRSVAQQAALRIEEALDAARRSEQAAFDAANVGG